MPPRKLGQKRETSLVALIEKLEDMHKKMGGDENKEKEEETLDEFTRLKKMSAKQIAQVRKDIAERDELLESSSGSGGKQSVQLSSKIREQLRAVQETHKKMQAQLTQEEKDLAKGKKPKKDHAPLTQDDLEAHTQMVDLVGKHISECEMLEKKRYTGRSGGRAGLTAGGRPGTQMTEIKRSAETSDLADIDPEIGQGLTQLKKNDQKLDEQLEMISKGMTRLKGMAVDQSNEVKLQSVMIDQISDNMDKATGHLNEVNTRLKETLAKAGGATSIIVKVILLVLLLAVGAYLYKMFA